MKARDLRNSILQMAVQGKLVPQDPADEPASALLGRIRDERAKLVKEKKIKAPKGGESVIYCEGSSWFEKRGKSDPVCIDDEIPFDIPESWEWVRLSTVSSINGGFAFKSTDYSHDGVRIVRISDFNEMGFVNTNIVRSKYLDKYSQFLLEEDDILLCMTGGTVGKSLLVKNLPEKMMVNQRVATIKTRDILPRYVYINILAPSIQSVIHSNKNSTNDNISMDTISDFLIPLPPLEEQSRILKSFKMIESIIKEYGTLENARKQLDAKLPEHLRNSILQMAVQGKLVPQDPADEPASALLGRIRDERAKLVKEKKIKAPKGGESVIYREGSSWFEKRGKSDPVCIDDEIPFEIPESWEWARVGFVFSVNNGFTPSKSNDAFWSNGTIPWFTAQDIQNQGREITRTESFITNEALGNRAICPPNTVLLCCTASVGETALTRIPLVTNQQFNALEQHGTSKSSLNPEYVFYWASQIKQRLLDIAGTTTVPYVSVSKLQELLIPIPPIEEQKRIAAKTDKLLTIFSDKKGGHA